MKEDLSGMIKPGGFFLFIKKNTYYFLFDCTRS